jgi:4-pyridoxolactonase
MSDTKVYILDHGEMTAKEYFLYWNATGEASIRLPAYSVLIDHDDGIFLFDSGFDFCQMEKLVPGLCKQSANQSLPAQLSLLGKRPSDITHVVNSHYHADHVGGNKHCLHAKTICHACELEQARYPEPFEAFGYSDTSFAPGLRSEDPELDIYTPTFETLRGDQEIARGVFLFETPGHTKGHYSLMVKLGGRRPMLFTADAAYTARTLERMQIASLHFDPIASIRSIGRLKVLSEQHDAELFFGHDIEQFGHYRLAPAYYS